MTYNTTVLFHTWTHNYETGDSEFKTRYYFLTIYIYNLNRGNGSNNFHEV